MKGLVRAAEEEVARLRACTDGVPSTRVALAEWLSYHIGECRERMNSGPARRRERHFRLRARPNLPAPIPRLKPRAERAEPLVTW